MLPPSGPPQPQSMAAAAQQVDRHRQRHRRQHGQRERGACADRVAIGRSSRPAPASAGSSPGGRHPPTIRQQPVLLDRHGEGRPCRAASARRRRATRSPAARRTCAAGSDRAHSSQCSSISVADSPICFHALDEARLVAGIETASPIFMPSSGEQLRLVGLAHREGDGVVPGQASPARLLRFSRSKTQISCAGFLCVPSAPPGMHADEQAPRLAMHGEQLVAARPPALAASAPVARGHGRPPSAPRRTGRRRAPGPCGNEIVPVSDVVVCTKTGSSSGWKKRALRVRDFRLPLSLRTMLCSVPSPHSVEKRLPRSARESRSSSPGWGSRRRTCAP
jgi:hypothetical protein